MTRRASRPFARTLAPALAAALGLSACALFASKSDYADYRAVRTAGDDRTQLLAMQQYVARHPNGTWSSEVQRTRRARDREVFEAGRSDRAGLELYLAAFPDGEFVGQAKSRLAAIAVIEQRKREEDERAKRLVEERKQRDEELRRTWVTRFFGYWTKTLIELQQWGSPIEQVARGNPEFSRAFGRPPRPRCTTEECVKYYESSYAVPVPGGTRLERAMRLWLRLRLKQGKLERAELLLPGSGFARWQELEERKPSVDGDEEARAKTLDWALGRVLPLLEASGEKPEPIANYTLAELPKLELASTGEQTDTTAQDPGAPANRIQGSAETPQPAVEELVKPVAPTPAADLEMETLQVDRQGRAIPKAGAPAPAPAPAAQAGAAAPAPTEEMVLDTLTVPQTPGAAPQAAPTAPGTGTPAPAAAAAPAAPAQHQPPTVRAYRVGARRVVVFAAPASDPAGFDGIVIEPMAPAKRGKAKPKPAPGAPPPAAKPTAPAPATP